MSQFNIDNAKLEEIAKTFNLPLDSVNILYTVYKDVAKDIEGQYLAHIIRAMEHYLQNKTGNPFFKIECRPVNCNYPFLNIGAHYFQGRFFTIYYHPKMDIKQLRVYLAHELGHLFIIEILNNAYEKKFTENDNTEPLSSIFGIFTILDKNEFYEKNAKQLNHKSWQEILADFSQLHNKNKNKLNIS